MNGFKSLAALAVLMLLSLAAGGCGGGGSHSKPEDAFNAMKEAVKKEDWKAFCDTLTEQSQEKLTAALALGGVFVADQNKEIADVMQKHGLSKKSLQTLESDPTKEEGAKKLIEPIKDRQAFIADFMQAAKKMGKDQNPIDTDAKLKDVTVSGDTAKGTMVYMDSGAEKSEPIEFRREQGSWKIQLPMNK